MTSLRSQRISEMPYWVYWDRIVRRVRIHRSECGACKGGQGMHRGAMCDGRGTDYDWEPAETYGAALRIVRQLERKGIRRRGDPMICGLCHPDRSADHA
jgi:hypothetical protein